jgi:hypothetical protein
MMGTREKLSGGHEWDVFSRKARHIVMQGRGVRSYVKRRFWKRIRKRARVATTDE